MIVIFLPFLPKKYDTLVYRSSTGFISKPTALRLLHPKAFWYLIACKYCSLLNHAGKRSAIFIVCQMPRLFVSFQGDGEANKFHS